MRGPASYHQHRNNDHFRSVARDTPLVVSPTRAIRLLGSGRIAKAFWKACFRTSTLEHCNLAPTSAQDYGRSECIFACFLMLTFSNSSFLEPLCYYPKTYPKSNFPKSIPNTYPNNNYRTIWQISLPTNPFLAYDYFRYILRLAY